MAEENIQGAAEKISGLLNPKQDNQENLQNQLLRHRKFKKAQSRKQLLLNRNLKILRQQKKHQQN
jgi:hypothetical protein